MAKLCVLLLAFAGMIFAQAAGNAALEEIIQNPPDIDFQIRTPEEQTVFRIGERIVVEVLISSRNPDRYRLLTGGCQSLYWSGSEEVSVDPKDRVTNPIYDYEAVIGGWGGSCLSSTIALAEEPFVTRIELNTKFRFERPGGYQVRVTSNRVAERGDEGPWFMGTKVSLTSPPLSLTIVETDAEWATRALSKAIQTLDSNPSEEEKTLAVRTLGYLGTAEAAYEMLRRFGEIRGPLELDLMLGLIASPHRAIVKEGLEATLAAPDRSVTGSHLTALVAIEAARRRATGEINRDDPSGDYWRAISDVRRDYLSHLGQIVARKEPAPRATSLVTLLEGLQQLGGSAGTLPGRGWEPFRATLAEVFPLLPEESQIGLLLYQWELISHPSLLSHLVEVYRNAAPVDVDRARIPMSLRGAAVRRIADLDPSLGRRIVIDEVRKEKLSVDVEALLHLPDEQLPELDATLAERFAPGEPTMSRDDVARLIERYATPGIYEAVKESYGESDSQDCMTQKAILAYFLRVDPDWGVQRVRKAVAYRTNPPTMCRDTLLDDLAREVKRPELEPTAIELLDDPEPYFAARAASWLGRHGAESGGEALWNKFADWSERWAGREAELEKINREADYRMKPEALETALAQALIELGGSDRHEANRARVRELCVSKRCREIAAPRQ